MAKRLAEDPQKRAAILQAALHEFAVAGYGASTDAIANRADVSKGTVFRYFDSKAMLYAATVNLAIENVVAQADFAVWTDSADLVSLIVRATQYKLELARQFPDEFALLIAVYQNSTDLPAELQDKVSRTFNQWTQDNIERLVDPVIDRLSIRADLDERVVRKYLLLAIKQISEQAQEYLQAHPDVKTIDQMTELIADIKMEMDILEHGIVG